MVNEERIEMARYRAGIYSLLAELLLGNPTSERLQALLRAASESDGPDAMRPSEAAFLGKLRELKLGDAEEARTEVATEYAELFVGPRPPLAPIYESVYLGPTKRLMSDQTMKVRAFYKRFGCKVEKQNSVPDDHMGLETSFLAELCAQEASALERGDGGAAYELERGQAEFLVVHLRGWADQFYEEVEAARCVHFYRAVAAFLRDFAKEDEGYLRDVLKEAKSEGRAA